MNTAENIIISADDAQILSGLLNGTAEQAAELLTEAFGGAEIVEPDRVPTDIVRLNAPVEYLEAETGARRRVTLVPPQDADPNARRISVLSPVGRAVLGRKVGMVSEADLPNGLSLELEIVAVEPLAVTPA